MNPAVSHWKKWKPSQSEPWDVRRIVHLHRRAGFAATWGMIRRDLSDGPDIAIDRLIKGTARTEGVPDDFDSMSRVIGDAAVGSNNINRLKAWWVYRMLFTPDPLGERLTLMWHNHFATSNLKVNDLGFMRQQNEILRKYSRSTFHDLLSNVIRDPAMLKWLDADANRKGNPNENLAREIMELFTLGVGNYRETDIKEAARALTGWTVQEGVIAFDAETHDAGEKRIFGEAGKFNGDDLIDLLIKQKATARRLAYRVCEMLLGESLPSDETIDELADGLRKRDQNVGWAVETVLRSELFFAAANIGNRIQGPIEFVVGSVCALDRFDPPPSTLLLAEWSAKIGQDLFYPPNVFGWPGGRDWLSSRALIHRVNYADALVLRLAANQLIRINDSVRLHPSLRGMAELLEAGQLSIVQGVGYPNPNRSHDVSMSIWQTARLNEPDHGNYGWIGRAMDQTSRPANGASHSLLVGDETVPVALRGRMSVAATIDHLDEMRRLAYAKAPVVTGAPAIVGEKEDLKSFVTRSLVDAYATSDLISKVDEHQSVSGIRYPSHELAQRLKTISVLIKADYGTRIYYAIQPGYDTHASQLPTHSRLLRRLGDGLKAFMNDMTASGLDKRVVVMCFSEFGRRVAENGSDGTDHGTAGPMFMAGGKIRSGLIGNAPSMSDLAEDGDLKIGIDFRSVYQTLLADWLKVESGSVLNGKFESLDLIA